MRPGAHALSLLATPLNVHVLESLREERLSLADLRKAVGHPPATTMRGYLGNLTEIGVIERDRAAAFPGSVTYGITASGEKLLAVAEIVRQWLDLAPEEPVELGSRAAKSAIKALIDGWSTGIVRALASRPFTLTEISRLISQTSYPTLERRLTGMRQVGLAAATPDGSAKGTPYVATRWLRLAVAPLAAATAWEQRWDPSRGAALGRIDIEAAFLLAVPLLELSSTLSGICRLAVELRKGSDLAFAGVVVTVEKGMPTACITRLSAEADAWATGTPSGWFRWVGESDPEEIELGGDVGLLMDLADGLRAVHVAEQRVEG
jgi:DNA-binding HxlR family transcriptional regulator